MSCGSSTPSAPPNTQASCSTVSERPNADARDSSGRSRWITASRQTLASALAVGADQRRRPPRWRSRAAPRPARRPRPRPRCRHSTTVSEWPNRRREPTALPMNEPTPGRGADDADAAAAGGRGSVSVCAFTTNATNSVRNPVRIRIAPLPHSVDSTPAADRARARPRARCCAGRPAPRPRWTPPSAGSAGTARRRRRPAPAVKNSAPGEPHSAATPGRDRAEHPAGDQPERGQPGVRGDQRDRRAAAPAA